jgi:hypothetical protein
MLRPVLLSLILIGAGASSVGEVKQPSDVATWRYQVSSILDAQHDEGGVIVSPAVGYDQDYQRYEGQGRPANGTIAH